MVDFHKRILFSDETHFWLNGYLNKQSGRIWSEANPQVYVETPLHPEKLTVWCALWAVYLRIQKAVTSNFRLAFSASFGSPPQALWISFLIPRSLIVSLSALSFISCLPAAQSAGSCTTYNGTVLPRLIVILDVWETEDQLRPEAIPVLDTKGEAMRSGIGGEREDDIRVEKLIMGHEDELTIE
ncbi:hypothetical protein TNCV_1181941 [Trichonephila clavipes]|nr:hypothetical protein TNCV_1181941 [Trichonephila clavipes]